MKIKELILSYISLISISLLTFLTIELISFDQLDSDFDSLSFIPNEAEFVLRIEAKEIGQDLLSEIIQKNLWSEFNAFTKSKIKTKPAEYDYSQVDYSYPIYVFSYKVKSQLPIFTVLKLKDPTKFIKSSNQMTQISFIIGDKCFLVSNCDKNLKNELEKIVIDSKSKKWETLLNTADKLAFKTNLFNLEGGIEIQSNQIRFVSKSNLKVNNTTNYQTLIPKALNLSLVNPNLFLDNTLDFKNKLPNKFSDLNSISLNYKGIKSPFYPQFELLLNTKNNFNVNDFISNLGMKEIEIIDNKIEIAGLNYFLNKLNNTQFIVSSEDKSSFKYKSSNDLLSISGDLNIITNLDEAPLLKLFMSSDPRFVSFSNFAQKTKSIDFQIIPSKNGNLKAMGTIIMKENSPAITEITKLFLSITN